MLKDIRDISPLMIIPRKRMKEKENQLIYNLLLSDISFANTNYET